MHTRTRACNQSVRVFMNFPVMKAKHRAFNPLKRIASPKRVFALITAGLTLLTIARVVVCLVEAYSSVRSERLADYELIRLCDDETKASSSMDFRTLCLKKRAERAAPILLKAILRAVTTAFSEFCEVFSSPARVALLVLFSLTGIAAPVVKAIVALFLQNLKRRRLKRSAKYTTSDSDESDDDDDDNGRSGFQVVEISPRHSHNTRANMGLTLQRPAQR